ncbi:MAG TPA: hypothetical protein VKB84_19225 [Candidatus Binataceae bacterium]|nr:hypothetical protein [Candidatus Binataceae bacterium]
MLKTFAAWIAAGALLASLTVSCAPDQQANPARVSSVGKAAPIAYPGATGANDGAADQSVAAPDGLFQDVQSPIGLDYAPEARCADENPNWIFGRRPRNCNPQLGQDERTCGHTLATCPNLCLKCYSDDLGFIRHDLQVNTITIYHPNYYVLKAARRHRMKVIVGLPNDAVLGLATPSDRSDCFYGGLPLAHCGTNYAAAMLDGACNDKVGGDPFKPCAMRCSHHLEPARQCVNGDCTCQSDSDCLGPSNHCRAGRYLAPLNNPASGEFLSDGTVIGLQLGNEFSAGCDVVHVSGLDQPCCSYSKKTGQCNAWVVNARMYSLAAQRLRTALNQRGAQKVKISVALVEKQGRKFCQNGKPPPGIDLIASHPYCDFVAEMPALWSTMDGKRCWRQARYEKFPVDQKACGVANTYIGETGFNSGCPMPGHDAALLKAEKDFVNAMVADEPLCKGQPNPTAPFPNSLFEFTDVCPPGGCLAGCGDPRECSYECCCRHNCTGSYVCSSNCPKCIGNGYFGLFRTPGYATVGFPLEPKFDPTPSLLCPAAGD